MVRRVGWRFTAVAPAELGIDLTWLSLLPETYSVHLSDAQEDKASLLPPGLVSLR